MDLHKKIYLNNFEDEEREHLDKMLAAGVIRPSASEWASAPVLVRKKGARVRWCVDFPAFNEKTVKDKYPLSPIEDCLDTILFYTGFSLWLLPNWLGRGKH